MFKWVVYTTLTMVAALIFFLIGALAIVRGAEAQSTVCVPPGDMRAFLFKQHRETLRSRMVTQGGTIYELYASPKGSWTMTFYHPTGLLCAGVSGTGYEENPPMMMPPPPKEAES